VKRQPRPSKTPPLCPREGEFSRREAAVEMAEVPTAMREDRVMQRARVVSFVFGGK
jgi:hypothetical protein